MLIAFTLTVLLVGFYILLSPPFKELRPLLGLPSHQYGSRYNETVNAAEIINPNYEAAKAYLARVTFVYHTVFIVLLYASLLIFAKLKIEDESIRDIIYNLSLVSALFTLIGGVGYSYLSRDFFFHGLFISGLAIMFVSGIIAIIYFRPKNLIDLNIWVSGLLLILGSMIGGWLGASFMYHRQDFIEALIQSRFNPDLAEENIFWRSLTGHEHAMIAIALTLIFLLAVSINGLTKGKLTRIALYLVLVGQIFTALAAYAVWPVGKIAHLIITPAALTLIGGTLLLSFRTELRNILSSWLKAGNIVMWLGVAIPGALVAMSLRKPLIFDPMFRDRLWDWAELAYNIGHWHILLLTWGITLLMIYVVWPKDQGKYSTYFGWITMIGYVIASLAINLYMLYNKPGYYIPNPYGNIWLSYLVEPGLTLISLGVAVVYLIFLRNSIRELRT